MAKRSSKNRARILREIDKPWEPFEEAPFSRTGDSQGESLAKLVEARVKHPDEKTFTNNRYQVSREPVPPERHGFGDYDLIWLSIKSRDKSARHDWREFQRIKNELAGADWEAVEIYPSEDRLVDSCNQFHLWCFPPEAGQFPLGWYSRFAMEENATKYGSQRPWEDGQRPDDVISAAEHTKMLEESLSKLEQAQQKGEEHGRNEK